MDDLYRNMMTADHQRRDLELTEYPTISLIGDVDKNAYKNALFTEKKIQCHVCGIEYSRTASESCPMCEMKKNMDAVMQILDAWRKQLGEDAAAPVNVPLSRYDKGDTIRFGVFNGIPIEWLVLDKKSDRLLVLVKYGLEVKAYNLSRKAVVWEESEIRRYLNKEFYEKCFSESSKKLIKTTLVMNKDNPIYRTPGGSDTRDKIYLLSINEAKEFLADNSKRECEATEYARQQGAHVDKKLGNSWWWLRSPGNYDYYASYVSGDGTIVVGGNNVTSERGVVRPAMWIKYC